LAALPDFIQILSERNFPMRHELKMGLLESPVFQYRICRPPRGPTGLIGGYGKHLRALHRPEIDDGFRKLEPRARP
jgi:hypothetical protein